MAPPSQDANASAEYVTLDAKVRLNEYFPSKFSGNRDLQEAEPHLLAFKDYLKALGGESAPLAQLKELFGKTLQGKARTWLEQQQPTSFDALKEAFEKQFGKTKSVDADRASFLRAKLEPTEPVREFLYKLRTWASRLNYDDEMVQYMFYEGLPSSYKQVLRPLKYEPVEVLVKHAEELQDEERSSIGKLPVAANTACGTSDTQELRKEIDSLKQAISEITLEPDPHQYCIGDQMCWDGYYPEQYYGDWDETGYYSSIPRGRSRTRGQFFRGLRRLSGRSFRGHGSRDRGFRGRSSAAFQPPRSHYHVMPERGFSEHRPSFSRGRVSRWANPNSTGPNQCDFCGRSGHTWKRCWDLRKEMNSDQDF